MSGLANRLVTAAGVHVSAVLDAETPEEVDALAVKAVVAVLRELAEPMEIAGVRVEQWISNTDLVALAEVIEKGEQA